MGKADLHIHTDFSDGSASVDIVLQRAVEKGLDIVAITDHNTIEGAWAAREQARRRGLPLEVIVGEEVTSSEGHVIGLFLKERIRPLLSSGDTIDEIHRQGGLAVAPHPFSLWLRLFRCGGVGRKIDRLQFDAVETANGSLMEGLSNWYTGKYNRRRTRLAEVGGSDAHTVEAVGQALTLYPGRGVAMLRQAIYYKATRVRESNGRMRALGSFLRDHIRGRMALFGDKGGYVSESSPI